ncbi:hypothetical protein E2C01_045589 [Portunus trituberculatus]|uniref:Secreted protein n=1 Tax=Portunus trituberculatus TaxID=210409 RepID=A0A5B7G2F3_PORTR|nr:hypothetical protein [Portunus trituberculatus]
MLRGISGVLCSYFLQSLWVSTIFKSLPVSPITGTTEACHVLLPPLLDLGVTLLWASVKRCRSNECLLMFSERATCKSHVVGFCM